MGRFNEYTVLKATAFLVRYILKSSNAGNKVKYMKKWCRGR